MKKEFLTKQVIKNKSEQAVTLIALIITIIILLILAGITLNLALDEDGIIRRAIKSGEDYEKAQKDELENLNEFENQLLGILSGEESIPKEVINISLNKEKITLDREDKETLIVTILPEEEAINKEVKWISKDEGIAAVNQTGEVTAKSVGETVIEAILQDGSNKSAECKVKVVNPTIAKKAQPGAYIKYEVPQEEFTMTPEQTGQDENQNFNTSTYTGLWRVLYNDEEHGLQIISDDIVAKLTLGHKDPHDRKGCQILETDYEKAMTAYNNAVSTVNTFSRYYVNAKYAVTGRCVGSNPINPDTDTEEIQTLFDFPKGSGLHLLVRATDYNFLQDMSVMRELNVDTASDNYWYASRAVGNTNSGGNFGLWYSKATGSIEVYNSTDFWGKGDGVNSPEGLGCNEFCYGIRPVITLKPDIKTNSGDGSEDFAFTIINQ